MKRALKKRVKAVLNNTPSSDDAPVELLNVMNPKLNNRVRRKAAMIGLAISMGATSLLVTRQSDQAQAAVPVGSQKASSSIPAVPDTQVKFASTKLESQAVSSASVPENPVIVEPTAVSQVPGLEAKWQVAASGISLQVPASKTFSQTTAGYKNSTYLKPQVSQGLNNTLAETSFPTVNNLSDDYSADGVDSTNTSLTAQPQIVATSGAVNSEINAQLKAQQEFALNRLQEKSNRLRKSLAQLQSGETKNLSQADIELAQPTTVVEKTALAAQPDTSSDASQANLISRLKQKTRDTASVPAMPVVIASSTHTAYEVKPGDTLAAIASRYNTSVSELVKANNLNNPNELRISQKLVIPAVQVEATVASKPTFVESRKTPHVATSPLNIGSANSYLPSSPSPTIADNSSVAVPTPVTVQIQANSATDSETTPPTTKSYGVGGDIAVPQAFAEIQQPKTPANRVARVNNNNNDRLQGLQAEIQRLQQKYRAQQSGNLVEPPAAIEANNAAMLTPISTPNNFTAPNRVSTTNSVAIPIPVPTPIRANYSVQPKPQFRTTVRPTEAVNPEFLPNLGSASQWTPSRTQSATRVATPSGRVNASDSLGKMRGTTVSPQIMPPLAAVDQYLPRPIDELTPPPSTSTLAYIWPTKGTLTSGFGMRWGRPHKGIDIANSTGTPVVASADGTIEKAGWNNGGYGNLVEIHHPDGSSTRYAHNSKILVQPGQQVHQGETIALMGTTGHSTGPHSHFEIHPSGKGAVNPIAFLPQRL
ncbi:peptidoglycan DD-metalloendopeptidase family protein [Nostoc sp. NMS4]|uniref:peptidoglycan DD-metalloendopeptidase family protein n=1 Tax=Nostoc sp. NMS4 TaxID=2815390 RepID=UPI0025F8717E|nr:peptidoglycan DD-metalloendopeptidase family protein [Nostoc sp. NMS4]MBN3925582.1 peptidoglycan DD-metalloendopeptidase family protein [Nostoc sp. NMS4]